MLICCYLSALPHFLRKERTILCCSLNPASSSSELETGRQSALYRLPVAGVCYMYVEDFRASICIWLVLLGAQATSKAQCNLIHVGGHCYWHGKILWKFSLGTALKIYNIWKLICISLEMQWCSPSLVALQLLAWDMWFDFLTGGAKALTQVIDAADAKVATTDFSSCPAHVKC